MIRIADTPAGLRFLNLLWAAYERQRADATPVIHKKKKRGEEAPRHAPSR